MPLAMASPAFIAKAAEFCGVPRRATQRASVRVRLAPAAVGRPLVPLFLVAPVLTNLLSFLFAVRRHQGLDQQHDEVQDQERGRGEGDASDHCHQDPVPSRRQGGSRHVRCAGGEADRGGHRRSHRGRHHGRGATHELGRTHHAHRAHRQAVWRQSLHRR